MNLVIDRSTWLTGNALDILKQSELRHSSGLQCCMGLYLAACGVTPIKLLHVGMPAELADALPPEASWLTKESFYSSDEAMDLQKLNDSDKLSNAQRERQVAEIFSHQDILVTYVGEYAEGVKVAKAYQQEAN